MNEFVNQKNWFQRHWKWLVPVTVVLVSMPILISPLGNSAKNFGSLYLNPSIYENALEEVRQHKEASELLGKPIETGFLIEGEVSYSDDGNSATMTIPIKGSKAKGRMDIEAYKLDNKWIYSLIQVRNKKQSKTIVIVDRK